MEIDLRRLRYLEAVLETGTFTAAAQQCHVAQPALWLQVRALEDQWGLKLFEKAGRRVRPTRAAEALRPFVRALLGQAVAVSSEVERVKTGAGPPTRIGTGYYNVRSFLAGALGRYARLHPTAALPELVTLGTADPHQALRDGAVDLAVGPDPHAHGLEGARLYPVWVAVAGRGIKPGSFDLRGLAGRPLAVLPRTFNSRLLLDEACARAGFVPRVAFEDSHVESLIALAGEGLATVVAVNEGLHHLPRGLGTARLTDRGRMLSAELWLMWRDEATLLPVARALRDCIVETARARQAATRARGPRAGQSRPPPVSRAR